MARKQFLILYPDRSREHITAKEREQLELRGLLKRIDETTYQYCGQVKSFHTFADLGELIPTLEKREMRRFLPGSFIIQHKEKRYRELLQTPEAMALDLATA